MPTIVVEIDRFGQPTIKADGFTGTACQKATAGLEAAYRAGAKAQVTRKPEMFADVVGMNGATVTTGSK